MLSSISVSLQTLVHMSIVVMYIGQGDNSIVMTNLQLVHPARLACTIMAAIKLLLNIDLLLYSTSSCHYVVRRLQNSLAYKLVVWRMIVEHVFIVGHFSFTPAAGMHADANMPFEPHYCNVVLVDVVSSFTVIVHAYPVDRSSIQG